MNGKHMVAIKPYIVLTLSRLGIFFCTVKSVLSGHSKIDKTKFLKTNGTFSLMKFESIAECSLGAFCNTFDMH